MSAETMLANKAVNKVKSTLKGSSKYFNNLREQAKTAKGSLLRNKHIDQMEAAYKSGDKAAMQRVIDQRAFHEGQFEKGRKAKAYQKSLKKPFRDVVAGAEVKASGELYVGLRSRLK